MTIICWIVLELSLCVKYLNHDFISKWENEFYYMYVKNSYKGGLEEVCPDQCKFINSSLLLSVTASPLPWMFFPFFDKILFILKAQIRCHFFHEALPTSKTELFLLFSSFSEQYSKMHLHTNLESVTSVF